MTDQQLPAHLVTSAEYRRSTPLFNLGRVGWALFDWANQGYTTIIITFIFATYFASGIVGEGASGQALWGLGIGISAFGVAVLAPLLGAVAQLGGRRRPWVIGFSLLTITLTACLFFMLPDPRFVVWALLLVVASNIAYELALVFNNAMLADVVDRPRMAKLGGVAWSGGYFGGLVTLGLSLALVLGVEFEGGNALDVRLTTLIVAGWFAVFLIPFIVFTPDTPPTGIGFGHAVRLGVPRLVDTVRYVWRDKRNIFWFLLGRMSYADGVNTIFAMGAVYASGVYGLETTDIILFGILLNVFSGAGGLGFAFFEERLGSKSVIMLSIIGLIVAGSAMLLAPSYTLFVAFGCLLGVFVGPIQQASRTMLAKLTPPQRQGDLFGLYAFTGRATSMLGPWLVAALTAWALAANAGPTAAQTIGMFGVMPFLVLGFVIMLFVQAPRREPA